jgi:hypothetical protein
MAPLLIQKLNAAIAAGEVRRLRCVTAAQRPRP